MILQFVFLVYCYTERAYILAAESDFIDLVVILNDAYALLFTYASSFEGIDCDTLESALHSDYAKYEVRRPPRLIRASKNES